MVRNALGCVSKSPDNPTTSTSWPSVTVDGTTTLNKYSPGPTRPAKLTDASNPSMTIVGVTASTSPDASGGPKPVANSVMISPGSAGVALGIVAAGPTAVPLTC